MMGNSPAANYILPACLYRIMSEEVAHASLLVYIAIPIPLLFIYLTSLKITIFSLLIPYSGVGRKNLLGGQTI